MVEDQDDYRHMYTHRGFTDAFEVLYTVCTTVASWLAVLAAYDGQPLQLSTVECRQSSSKCSGYWSSECRRMRIRGCCLWRLYAQGTLSEVIFRPETHCFCE